jgi:hypothetical protein
MAWIDDLFPPAQPGSIPNWLKWGITQFMGPPQQGTTVPITAQNTLPSRGNPQGMAPFQYGLKDQRGSAQGGVRLAVHPDAL